MYKKGIDSSDKVLKFLKTKEIVAVPLSIRDIQSALGISSTSIVIYHLDNLEKRGLIKRDKNKARLIYIER